YLTLPVLCTVAVSPCPARYGHTLNWAILAALAVIGVATRYWFNLRNQGRKNVWILPAAALGLVALALVTAPRSGPALSSVGSQVSFAEVRLIVARRCAGCHSSAPTTPGIPAAPLGVLLDTPLVCGLAPIRGERAPSESSGGSERVADPTLLPVASGQAPDASAYYALHVVDQPAGFSYNDPVTSVRIWKVTSSIVPAAN